MSWSIGTVYTKPWFWRKGNRVSTVSDSVTIVIGDNCQDETTEKKSKKAKRIENNRMKSTKYTLVTFLPQNLLEQFRRIANFYFLIMTIIAIVIDSPVSPLTSLIPLMFVISVTAVKQGYEDFLRYKADNMVNYSDVTVIRNGSEIDISCQDILQGDLVKASRDCDVPCDLVLLKSSDPNGKCYITTANLDGETNLKTLYVPQGFSNDVEIEKLHNIGTIECEQPRADLYIFNGRLEIGSEYFKDHEPTFLDTLRHNRRILPLTADHLLLRGSRIRNTEWAIGCAAYTGQNTKLAINSQIVRSKISSSEKFINKFLIFFLIVLITMVTFAYFMKRYNDLYHSGHQVYFGVRIVHDTVSQFIQEYFSFLILFNYLIPISLYVTIELHKFLGAFFMEWDRDLYDIDTNQQCIVNTSDLNEELGQVKILFSDKTGTLTKNEMILQQVSVNGKKFKIHEGGVQEERKSKITKLREYNKDVLNFFQALCVCHTVQVGGSEEPPAKPDENDEEIESSFEIVESVTTLIELDDDARRKIQTRSNTLRNEMSNEEFLLSESLENLPKSPIPRSIHQHKRAVSSGNVPRISFNLEKKIYSIPSDQSVQYSPDNTIPKVPSPLTLPQPVAGNLKRTVSIDVEKQRQRVKYGHRRTQSATMPGTPPNIQSNVRRPSGDIRRQFYRSTSNIANSREYYAAPAYNEATLLERKESLRRSMRVKSVIEQLDYQASSPDEKALVEGCAKAGFLYTGENNGVLNVKLQYQRPINNGKNVTSTNLNFERLYTLEFTSDRKRMSTIIRDPIGQIWLYTKGAESHVLPLCKTAEDEKPIIDATQRHVDDFAKLGLRTLAIGRRKMKLDEFRQFYEEIITANNSLANRKTLIEEVHTKIEQNLQLLGATAVEDALQDGVKDTIESLRYAGIMVWVLTGDKIETALNIAKACGHIPENAFIYFITECKEDFHVNQHLNVLEEEINKAPLRDFTLLIDGPSLSLTLRACSNRFRDLAVKCRAVLCCRLSPLQKCEIVQLMKTLPDEPITAAIGDGANDVSMIQEAHVGLGIVGKEGRQAARCADYAFANFSMLKKVLLVHGHYYTQRLSLLVLYFFYKNLVFMLIQVYFQSNNLFSAETIYQSVFLTFYNVAYTSLPILVLSLTEKTFPETMLMKTPSLYKTNTGYKHLTWKYFIGWIVLAVYHSLVVYFFGYSIWHSNNAIMKSAHTVDFFCYGTFMIHNIVFLVNLKLWLVARYQSFIFILTILGSISTFMTSTVVYNSLYLFDGQMLNVYNNLITSATFWILNVLIIITALLPDYTIKAFRVFDIKIRPVIPIDANVFLKKRKYLENSNDNSLNSTISESTYL